MSDTDAKPKPDPKTAGAGFGLPSLADMQHWTLILGRLQQLALEHGLAAIRPVEPAGVPAIPGVTDPDTLARAEDFWRDSIALWQHLLTPQAPAPAERAEQAGDRRFRDPRWHDNPVFDWIRQSYLLLSDHMLRTVDSFEGVDERQRRQLRFTTRAFIDAMSPSNFPATNPQVLEKTIETRGENLVKGLQHMLADLSKGQLTQAASGAFELGRNLATTPGKVIHRTPLYELIQYAPTTPRVLKTPIVIFPPWINRFYILDLTPENSFVRWAVAQGITVFMVSWRSADASMKHVVWDDSIAAQVAAIETVRSTLGVEQAHTIGYCVAGTTLAATLAVLAARGRGDIVASATFFTAQVDFADAGELLHFIDDTQLAMFKELTPEGYLDGRYMAMTFNLLRGRDLIWNYVTNNYLLGNDYAPFDLLHWNGDTTNLPAKWHMSYLTDLYRDNLLAKPGAMTVDSTPVDLGLIKTPAYVQAGRYDHIAPTESVWKLTEHLRGPIRFVLAGSGHIAGVVNHPDADKYQYWSDAEPIGTLDDFKRAARETRGSWWPDWAAWLRALYPATVRATGARKPGTGKRKAIEDAPGRYVRER
ncbi:class I poly(R)-hydroxyalkanoic acid synthase [soil metagenome]